MFILNFCPDKMGSVFFFVVFVFCFLFFFRGGGGGGGGGGTLIFSLIRRLGSYFGVQNFEFQYFGVFSEK